MSATGRAAGCARTIAGTGPGAACRATASSHRQYGEPAPVVLPRLAHEHPRGGSHLDEPADADPPPPEPGTALAAGFPPRDPLPRGRPPRRASAHGAPAE